MILLSTNVVKLKRTETQKYSLLKAVFQIQILVSIVIYALIILVEEVWNENLKKQCRVVNLESAYISYFVLIKM